MSQNKLKKGASKVLSDIKNVKKNYDVVKSNPYASLKFRYIMQRAIIFLLVLFFIYQFYNIIVKYNGGSSVMTLIGRGLILLILVVVITKAWETLKPIKNAMKRYEQHPEHINYRATDVKKEVNDILQEFEEKEKDNMLKREKNIYGNQKQSPYF